VRFSISQRFTGSTPRQVIDAYTDPALYATFEGLTKIGRPEVVDRRAGGSTVSLTLRMRFIADLNAAARRVVDPAKLSWLQHEDYDLSEMTAKVVFAPENYADRFSSSGGYRFAPDPDDPTRTVRTIDGDLRVRMLLVGGQVEGAVVSGLREHFAEEEPLVQHWLDRHRLDHQEA
jgi:hypothetical protein